MATDSSGTAACPVAGTAPVGILGPLPGFRHFLGEPAAADRFRVDGADPRRSAAAMATLRRRLRGLALLMGDRPRQAAENPAIPAGYTYLLQLTAHDLVSTTTAFWAAGGPAPGVANAQAAPLRLHTLYGAGSGGAGLGPAPSPSRRMTRATGTAAASGCRRPAVRRRPAPCATSAGRRPRALSAPGAAMARR